MNKQTNILILECTTSHCELIFSQLQFLNAYNFKIHLWINEKADITYFSGLPVTLINTADSRLQIISKLVRYIRSLNIDYIIFNTAHGSLIRDLSIALLFSKVKAIGILHQAEKVAKSFTQRIISLKVRNYFVLSDHVLSWLKANSRGSKINFSSFYPIFFPVNNLIKNSREDEFVVCIPGAIEPERKDYNFLINFLRNQSKNLNSKVKFQLLGNISTKNGRMIYSEIKKHDLNEWFLTFDSYVSNDVFYQNAFNSKIIMPLIHPTGQYFNSFLNKGISGAFNLAFALKNPLLLHQAFRENKDFDGISIFYAEDELLDILNRLSESTSDILKLIAGYKNISKFDFAIQAEKYCNFIFDSPK